MSNYLILCYPFLLLPSTFPSIRVFSNESALCIRWTKYWSFGYSNSPSNECSGLISLGLTGLIFLQSKGLSRVFSSTTIQKHQFFGTQPFFSGPTPKSRLCAEYSEGIWEKWRVRLEKFKELFFTIDNIHVLMLFSRNFLPSPSPTESKSLFCTSVSLFLFCI